MKKQILLAASLLFLSIQANAVVISLEGKQADGAGFNIFGLNNTNTDEVLAISFNFVYEALTPSWGTDLVVEIGHLDSGNFFQIGTQGAGCTDLGVLCDFDLAWSDGPGIFNASGMISLAIGTILNGSGNWEVLIADSFDDNGVDGQFLAGSFIEVNQGTRVAPANSPSIIFMLVMAAMFLLVRNKIA